jgi:uncharacterized protein (TIGR02444 family)
MTATEEPPPHLASEDAWVETVWAGTSAIYASPDIRDLCLSLQDEEGLCVPTLFCVCFAAAAGLIASPERAALLIAGDAPLRAEIGRMRARRRAARPAADEPPERRQAYDALKQRELSAERALMEALSHQ